MEAAVKKETRFTYADYCAWPDDERWELIDGAAYAMSSPTASHQAILVGLIGQLYVFLRGKKCKVFAAPFDVRLNADGADDTVVQPDILVVCDETKLSDGKCVRGAPDLVIEILSPSTAMHDKVTKFNLYHRMGVREYWIVDPDYKMLHTHVLGESGYITRAYDETGVAPVNILEGCVINLADVFEGAE